MNRLIILDQLAFTDQLFSLWREEAFLCEVVLYTPNAQTLWSTAFFLELLLRMSSIASLLQKGGVLTKL